MIGQRWLVAAPRGGASRRRHRRPCHVTSGEGVVELRPLGITCASVADAPGPRGRCRAPSSRCAACTRRYGGEVALDARERDVRAGSAHGRDRAVRIGQVDAARARRRPRRPGRGRGHRRRGLTVGARPRRARRTSAATRSRSSVSRPGSPASSPRGRTSSSGSRFAASRGSRRTSARSTRSSRWGSASTPTGRRTTSRPGSGSVSPSRARSRPGRGDPRRRADVAGRRRAGRSRSAVSSPTSRTSTGRRSSAPRTIRVLIGFADEDIQLRAAPR